MTASDIKLRIFRQIDALEKDKLDELYGVLLNYINSQQDISDWDILTEEQKTGIYDAIQEIEMGKGVPNHVVLEHLLRYS
ncbi:MAG: hypothetical protein NTZ69_06110 [Bacteroidia bacterium]|nr:hypothetical protein [Bacteroidia bacterium]